MHVFDKRMLKKLSYWICEREAVRHKKEELKLPKPWTKDPLLMDYRWCNVRRMDDRVSKWLLDMWYHRPWAASPQGAMVLATLGRLINWPDSLNVLMDMREWQLTSTIKRLQDYRDAGNKVFTGAYIINGAGGGDKIVTVCNQVNAVYNAADRMLDSNSMERTWEKLMSVRGIGSFMAGQIVADLRQFYRGAWGDRMRWAPLGPGSARGMRRLLGVPPRGTMGQQQFNDLLPQAWEELMGYEASEVFDNRSCEAMDLQNCLCEFDKYQRLTNNEGHVRSGYPGRATQEPLL